MQVEWYGQSAFRLSTPQQTVFIDPFADLSQIVGPGIQFDYPPILPAAAFDTGALPVQDGPVTVVPAAP